MAAMVISKSGLILCAEILSESVGSLNDIFVAIGADGKAFLAWSLGNDSYRFNDYMIYLYDIAVALVGFKTDDAALLKNLLTRLRKATFWGKHFAMKLDAIKSKPTWAASFQKLIYGLFLASSATGVVAVQLCAGKEAEKDFLLIQEGMKDMRASFTSNEETITLNTKIQKFSEVLKNIHGEVLTSLTNGLSDLKVSELESLRLCGKGLVKLTGGIAKLPEFYGWTYVLSPWPIKLSDIPVREVQDA